MTATLSAEICLPRSREPTEDDLRVMERNLADMVVALLKTADSPITFSRIVTTNEDIAHLRRWRMTIYFHYAPTSNILPRGS